MADDLVGRCRLYLITPPEIQVATFADDLAAALAGGDVACLQLRLKGADDAAIEQAIAALQPVARAHDVAFLVNDRPDLAAAHDCDGVHVGQEDATYAAARAAVGDDAIVGVTCHDSRDLAIQAADAGADYVAFGAFFETTTKDAKTRATPDLLTWWSEATEIPCVAIGGITVDNGGELAKAGADFLAVSSGVWRHGGGPGAAVAAFNEMLDANRPAARPDVASDGPS